MSPKKKVIVIGEMHRDLKYKTDALSKIVYDVTTQLVAKKAKIQGSDSEIRSIVSDALQSTTKKYICDSTIVRGGNGNNSATIFAKLGVPTGLFTVIGNDSEWMKAELEELGIDTSTVFIKNLPTPTSTVIEDTQYTKIFTDKNLKDKMNFDGVEFPIDLFADSMIVFITPMAKKYKHILEVAVNAEKLTAVTIELQKITNFSEVEELLTTKPEILFANLDDAFEICKNDFDKPFPSFDEFKQSLDKDKNPEYEYQLKKLINVDLFFGKLAKVRIYTSGSIGSWVRFGPMNLLYREPFKIDIQDTGWSRRYFCSGILSEIE